MQNILIVTGGMSPQVVTETLWALVRKRRPEFWPTKVIVVVTSMVEDDYKMRISGHGGKIAELAKELRKPFRADMVEIAATDCADIRSDSDAIAFGDKVCEIVQRETANPDTIVHLSLAGGRKTMSFHGGAAMTLFGRPQDELSHVLVDPAPLEGCPDFWWPTPNERRVAHRSETIEGKPRLYNTQAGEGPDRARVHLALVPFVRARQGLPTALLLKPMKYQSYVAQVNAAIEGTGTVVELLTTTSTLRIAGGAAQVKLEPQDFAVYWVLAERAKAGVAGCGPNGNGGNHVGWLSAPMVRRPDLLPGETRHNPVARLAALGGSKLNARLVLKPKVKAQQDLNYKAFSEAISRIRNAIGAAVADQVLANRLMSEPAGGRSDGNPARFGLLLSPHEIAIRADLGGPEIPPFAHVVRIED